MIIKFCFFKSQNGPHRDTTQNDLREIYQRVKVAKPKKNLETHSAKTLQLFSRVEVSPPFNAKLCKISG